MTNNPLLRPTVAPVKLDNRFIAVLVGTDVCQNALGALMVFLDSTDWQEAAGKLVEAIVLVTNLPENQV